MAYALPSANLSRIFATLGADPHNLSYFWILPPLMGILVQPIVGTLSDKTWTRWGRRIPYLFIGAAVAVAVMCLLPNSGSLGLGIGAAILIACVIYTTMKVKEWNPQEYAEYNGSLTPDLSPKGEGSTDSGNWLALLKNAPSTFWKVGLVQFFCWAAFLYMWNYTTGAIAEVVWDTTDPVSEPFQEAGNWVGVLFAVQAMGSVVWAAVLPQFKNTKLAYATSLVIGGIGFMMVPFLHDQYLQFIPFLLIGCAWAAMLAMPFTFVTNALQGYGHMGAYLGLFNGTICIPQIIAALCGGIVLSLVGHHQSTMMIVSAVLLIIGACCVTVIKVKK